MPHAVIYRRPERRPQRDFVVNIRTEAGHEQYTMHVESRTQAEREALAIFAAEHDRPISVWTEACE